MGVVCCQVEVCVSGLSLVQRSSTECGVSEYVHEASIMRKHWPTRGGCAMVKNQRMGVVQLIETHIVSMVYEKDSGTI